MTLIEKWEFIKDLKEVRRGRISEVADAFPNVTYHDGKRPWSVPVQVAFPCATQNEINEVEALELLLRLRSLLPVPRASLRTWDSSRCRPAAPDRRAVG